MTTLVSSISGKCHLLMTLESSFTMFIIQATDYIIFQDKSIWLKFQLPFIGEIRFNPVVTFCSIFLIWGFAIWCILLREEVPFNMWRTWIVEHLTWLYMGTLVILGVLLLIMVVSLGFHCPIEENLRVVWDKFSTLS